MPLTPGEPHRFEQFRSTLFSLGFRKIVKHHRQRDVLQCRHGRDEVEGLEDNADIPAAMTREIVL